MSQEELTWALANIPLLAQHAPQDFTITAMPGYTNFNYRLCIGVDDWVLRLPRTATDAFIDRAAEAYNQTLAHELGLAPQAVWRNTNGMTLTPTLRHSRNLRASDFDNNARLQTIVRPLQQLHRSGLEFHGRETLGALLLRHYELLDSTQRAGYAPRIEQAQRILSLLEHEQEPWVASHRDLVMGNLLLEHERLWIIDWEYSAMASPYWDLATLCNEADLDQQQSRCLLQAYCAGGPAMKESRLFDYRGLLKLFTDCWMSLLAK